MRALRRFRMPALLTAVVIGGLIAGAAWLRWPRRIDVSLDGAPAVQQMRAGTYMVTITSTRRSGNDNGVATVHVASELGAVAADAAFNYDTLMDQPAGSWHYAWIDADLWPDVRVDLNTPASRVIMAGSADGVVREVTAP